MDKQKKSENYHHNSFNCSQSVFTVFGTEYGLSEDDCLRISCAFGGGMGRQQNVCGAVTGALMALGLNFGKGLNDPDEMKSLTYEKTREFFREFKKMHESVNCMELLGGLDLNDPVDHKRIIEEDLFQTRCGKYITDSVSIAEKLINEG